MDYGLLSEYNYGNWHLKTDEKMIYIFSDGRTRAMLYAVLILNDNHELHVRVQFYNKRRKEVERELVVEIDEEFKQLLEGFSGDPDIASQLNPEYDFRCLGTGNCLFAFRNKLVSDPYCVKIYFPVEDGELEARFQSEREKDLLALMKKMYGYIQKARASKAS